jgi:hypothetical protein
MSDFADIMTVIKTAAIEAVNTTNPVEATYGEVVLLDPLCVRLATNTLLDESRIVFLRSNTLLSIGDKLVMLKVFGGQKYLSAGKYSDFADLPAEGGDEKIKAISNSKIDEICV